MPALPAYLKEALQLLRVHNLDLDEERIVSLNTQRGLLEATRAKPGLRREVQSLLEAERTEVTSGLADVSGKVWSLTGGRWAIWVRPGIPEPGYIATHELLHVVDFEHGHRGETWVYKTHARLLKKEVTLMKRSGASASAVHALQMQVLYALDGVNFTAKDLNEKPDRERKP